MDIRVCPQSHSQARLGSISSFILMAKTPGAKADWLAAFALERDLVAGNLNEGLALTRTASAVAADEASRKVR